MNVLDKPPAFTLTRNAFGRLVLRIEGTVHDGVVPVRNFPMSAPDAGLSLVDGDGKERLWVERLALLPAAARELVEEELRSREFIPRIRALLAVSTFTTPSTWEVDTDRGPTHLVLKGEEDIRRLPGGALLVTDSQGIQFMVADWAGLDRKSKRLFERFL